MYFERNVERDIRVTGGYELRVSAWWGGGVPESWNNDRKGPFTLPRDVGTYGMDRTDESDDLVHRPRVRWKRKTIVMSGSANFRAKMNDRQYQRQQTNREE